jgi:SAM-dependent methyltransferase
VPPSATTTSLPPDTTRDTYDALAPIYDALGGWRWFGVQVAERLETLIADRGLAGRPLAFLDLGCGTGRLLSALRRAHPDWRLAGADASQQMLRMAAQTGAPGISWARALLPGPLPFRDRFDLVGAFHDTMNHLADAEALTATFRTVAAILRPRGLLVFDLTNEHGFTTWWQRGVDLETDDFRYLCAFDYRPETRTARAEIALTRGAEERRLVLTQRWFSEPIVEAALRAAGFRLKIAAPWSPFKPNDPGKTWFVAQIDKPEANPR